MSNKPYVPWDERKRRKHLRANRKKTDHRPMPYADLTRSLGLSVSMEECADRMGLSVRTVATIWHTALCKIVDAVEQLQEHDKKREFELILGKIQAVEDSQMWGLPKAGSLECDKEWIQLHSEPARMPNGEHF
jgi:hypothetical protein